MIMYKYDLAHELKQLSDGPFDRFKPDSGTPWETTYVLGESQLLVNVYGSMTYNYIVNTNKVYTIRIDNQHGYIILRVPGEYDDYRLQHHHNFIDKMYTEEEYFQQSLVSDFTMSYNEHIEVLKFLRMIKKAHPEIYNGHSWPSL